MWLSLAFMALVVVHIILAWSWFKGKAKGLFGKAWRPALGLTLVTAVLIPVIFWPSASKNDPAYAEFGEGHGRQGGRVAEEDRTLREPLSKAEAKAAVGVPAEAVITGKMTLREVERATGVPAKDIVARLGLPAEVSPDETLGRLRQAYAFDMQALRDVVAQLLFMAVMDMSDESALKFR